MMIPRLTKGNVVLGTLETADWAIEKYTKWISDENIAHWIDKSYRVINFEEEKKWATTSNNEIRFSIYLIENQIANLIGTCSISLSSCNTNATLGVLIGEEDKCNNGIGAEVVNMLTDFAFNELRVHRCHLIMVEENQRALKCYQKAGFEICGTEHEAFWYHGHYANILHMEKFNKG